MKELPIFLNFFKSELGYDVTIETPSLGYDIFYIDLSPLKLRLSSQTPVVYIESQDLGGITPYQLVQSLQDVIREKKWGTQTVIVLISGKSEPVLKYTSSPLYDNLVIIGDSEQETIRRSRRPTGELADIVSAQVPISLLSPYETTTPVTGSRFFGREYELKRILANLDTNYAVLGNRRIGKTSLLREIERILLARKNAPKVVYKDCSDLFTTDDYVREVVRELNEKEMLRLDKQKFVFFFPNFLERMHRKYNSKIVFLLDEIDHLIKAQRGDWELFRMLRASSNKGVCQYVIAGYREAIREHTDINSPFYKFAQEVPLQEFSRQQAHDLIVTPMENLRVRFTNKDEVVGRIYEETAGHPNLIQHYCTILLKRLDETGERQIGPDNLFDVYADESFRRQLLTSFMQNTQNREKALVYALLSANHAHEHSTNFTQSYIDACLQRQGMRLSQFDIDQACNLLRLAGVFHQKGKDLSFTSPIFVRMLLETHDLQYLVKKIKEEGI